MNVKKRLCLHNTVCSILLIQLGDIGDVVLTLPCIRALRENYPEANIQVAVREKAEGLIRGCHWANGVVPISKGKMGLLGSIQHQVGFIKELRSHHFDLAIDLRTGTRGAIMAFLTGARERISFRAHDEPFWRNWLFTTLIEHPYNPTEYVAEYLLSFLATSLGIRPLCPVPQYTVSVKVLDKARNVIRQEGISEHQAIIALQPFSLWGYKELPEATVVELINKIQKYCSASIILIGGKNESDRAASLMSKISGGVYNLVGKTTIELLPAILKSCSLFTGIDSAGIHIAAAVGTPTIAIFGPSSPQSWAPKGDKHSVIRPDAKCAPCRQKGCDGNGFSRCLWEISAESIARQIRNKIQPI